MGCRELTRREFIKVGVHGLGGMAAGMRLRSLKQLRTEAQRPNILFVFSDQQHWRAAGFQDGFFETPNLDRFAERATVFDQSFCTTPQCSPSRSSIMTGFYPSKTGVMANVGRPGGNPLRQRTIGKLLQEAGYRTGYFGKWHLGGDKLATAGWDEDFGVTDKKSGGDSRVTQKAAEFLAAARNADKPFALFVSYVNPHDIYRYLDHEIEPSKTEVPLPASWYKEKFEGKPSVQKQFMLEDQGAHMRDKDETEWQHYRHCYRTKVALYDSELGGVLGALKEAGLGEDTIVIVTSDHGDMDANHRMVFKGPFMYEHMVRIPLIVDVPRRFGGANPHRINDLDVVNVDLVPTILDFCGIEATACDGVSLKPVLTGEGTGQKKRDYVIGQYYGKQRWVNPVRMLRTSEFKYNRYIRHGEELYDLRNDPDELVNLAADPGYAGTKTELASELDAWIKANDDPFYSLVPTTRAGDPLGEE